MARPMVRFENRVTKSYLVAYNLAQFVGWFFVLLKLVESLYDTFDYRSTYAAVGGTIRYNFVFKSLIFAIFFIGEAAGDSLFGDSARRARYLSLSLISPFISTLLPVQDYTRTMYSTGLVRSDPQTAVLQWAGRTHVLVAIIDNLPEVQTNVGVFITFAAWSITEIFMDKFFATQVPLSDHEIVRYPQYGLSGLGVCPKWLTWLRYTLFIVLYPAGVYGEMLALYAALGPIRDGELSFKIFDSLPITYYSFIIGLLMVYPLLFLVLYRHMFKQRRSRLGPKREAGARRIRKDK